MDAVVYFSASGITKEEAIELAATLKADLFEIQPEIPYTDADLDWMDSQSRTSIEMGDKTYRPAMKPLTVDTSKYDTIYLGFPIWWYVAPTIINTFLEANDFSGANVKLFATSGGSGFGNTIEELQDSAPGAKFTTWRLNGREL